MRALRKFLFFIRNNFLYANFPFHLLWSRERQLPAVTSKHLNSWLFARKRQLLELDLTEGSKTNPYVHISVFSNDLLSLSFLNKDPSMDQSHWQTWKDLFLAALKDNIPTKLLRDRNPVPWLTCAVIRQFYQEKGNRTQETKIAPVRATKSQIQTLRSQVKRAIRESRDEFFESTNIEFKINPWSLVSIKNSLKVAQHTTKCLHGNW